MSEPSAKEIETCKRKIVYFSRKNADKFKRTHRSYGNLDSYRCPVCGFWHLGHADHRSKAHHRRRGVAENET